MAEEIRPIRVHFIVVNDRDRCDVPLDFRTCCLPRIGETLAIPGKEGGSVFCMVAHVEHLYEHPSQGAQAVVTIVPLSGAEVERVRDEAVGRALAAVQGGQKP